ncbi:MAG TPA: prenyltransferase [Planctomycetota bacterium]|nr:prenyltransferase [Planctomycetota bacterium]
MEVRTAPEVDRTKVRRGLWKLADPKISITSAVAMLVGTAVAVHDGHFAPGWLAVLAFALFCMEVAKNAWGEVVDFDSGTDLAVADADRTGFSGGKRVMVDGLLSRAQTWMIAAAFGGAGVALGAVIVLGREPDVLWLGVLGLVLGWSYHGPPLRLCYRGLGELDVVLCYGPLMVLSTYWIQARQSSVAAIWVAVPLGLLIAAFLWVNEFPDYRADLGAGKRNLVVRLGQRRASRVLPWIHAAGYAVLALVPSATGLPLAVWAGFAALPLSFFACWHTWREPTDFYRSHPVQQASLLAFVAYALGSALGILYG